MTGDDSREALTVKSLPGKAVGSARGKPDMLRSQEAKSESAGYVSHLLSELSLVNDNHAMP